MKKRYTAMLLLMLSFLAAHAQFPPQRFNTSGIRIELTPAFQNYTVIINGQPYALLGSTLQLDALPAGRNFIQIGYYTGLGRGRQFVTLSGKYFTLNPGQRLVTRVNQRGQLIFLGYEALFPVISQCPTPPHQPYFPQPQCPPAYPHFPHQGQYHPGNHGQGWGFVQPMNQQDFSFLLNSIRMKSFDSDRLLIAQQGIRNNGIRSAQISEIMELFSFEDTRLDFAKFAYDYCSDKQHFYQVNNAFSFSGSIQSLEQHIMTRR